MTLRATPGRCRWKTIEANYSSLAELARAHNIRVVFSSVLPVHNYTPKSQDFFAQRSPEKILALNRWLKDYCAANALVYLDYFTPMVDDKGLAEARSGRGRTASQPGRVQDHGAAGGGGDSQGAGRQSLNSSCRGLRGIYNDVEFPTASAFGHTHGCGGEEWFSLRPS